MLTLLALLACDTGSNSAQYDSADTGTADAMGGQEGEEFTDDTGDTSTDAGTLTTSSDTVSFGTRFIGCTTEETVTVSNNTDTPVNLSSIEAEQNSPELYAEGAGIPALLNPGESISLGLRYAPLNEGSDADTITLYADNSGDLQIGLVGEGQAFRVTADSFLSSGGTQYTLTAQPVTATLAVTVDGNLIPSADWSYEEGTRQITLASPPPDGAELSARYTEPPPSCD